MPRLPSVGSREVVKAFMSFGWQVARQSSSHITMVWLFDENRHCEAMNDAN